MQSHCSMLNITACLWFVPVLQFNKLATLYLVHCQETSVKYKEKWELEIDLLWEDYNKGCENFNEGQPITPEF